MYFGDASKMTWAIRPRVSYFMNPHFWAEANTTPILTDMFRSLHFPPTYPAWYSLLLAMGDRRLERVGVGG